MEKHPTLTPTGAWKVFCSILILPSVFFWVFTFFSFWVDTGELFQADLNGFVEKMLAVGCPLLSVGFGLAAVDRAGQGKARARAWCWGVVGLGVLLSCCALVISLRDLA
jgi:hypothetical protein